MISVNIRQAKRNLSNLIRKAIEGETVVIVSESGTMVQLVPVRRTTQKRSRKPGSMKGTLQVGPEFFEPLPEDEWPMEG